MLKSVEEVSEELGISKAAVYKKLKDEKYSKLIIKENGKMMISEELLEELKKNQKRKIEIINEVEIVDKKDLEVIKNESDKKILEILLKQLEEKDNQINKLQDLIASNQIIIKNQQEKEKEQLKLEEHFKEIDRKLVEIRQRNNRKKHFFFKRREKSESTPNQSFHSRRTMP